MELFYAIAFLALAVCCTITGVAAIRRKEAALSAALSFGAGMLWTLTVLNGFIGITSLLS